MFPLAIASYDFFSGSDPYNIIPLQGILTGMGAGLLVSMALLYLNRDAETNIGSSEAILLVFLSWSVGAVIASLPFFFWAQYFYRATSIASPFINFFNCLFEGVSGLTTTGASILSDIPAVPDALLFWRAFIQWYGGLGIVVLFVAILPMIAGGNKRLFSAEATGISKDGNTPKIQETAQTLWLIYVCFTVVQIVLMLIVEPEMGLFAASTLSFSTAATAGFSIFNESAGGLSPAVQWIIISFMLISGVNFGLYYQVLQGRWRSLFNDTEFKTYVGIVFFAILIIAWNIEDIGYNDMSAQLAIKDPETIARDAAFQVASIQTTTGFSNANFDSWPALSHFVLLALMFIGGCGGSTGGGIKVSRIVVAFKLFFSQLEKVYRPAVIRPVKIGGSVLTDAMKQAIILHILAVIFLSFLGGVLLIIFEPEIDHYTAFTASVATINNIGPGFSMVGATENYSWMSDQSKSLLILWMLIGRLEVFTVLVLFTRRFWKQN